MFKPEGIAITSEADIQNIPHTSEQQFARVLLQQPQLKVTYEQESFAADTERIKNDGSTEIVTFRYTPDFTIINTNNPKAGPIHVEITQHKYDPATDPPELDPKARKRFVIGQDPKLPRYVILYRLHLERIEQATGITIIDFNLREIPASITPIAS